MRISIAIIFCISTFVCAFGAEFIPDDAPIVLPKKHLVDSSKTPFGDEAVSKISFFKNSKEWATSWPAPDRVLLSNQSNKKFILVVEYNSKISLKDAEDFLLHQFGRIAKVDRPRALNINNSIIRGIEADSALIQDQRVGRVSFDLNFADKSALFTERVWAEKGHLWQIVMVSTGAFSAEPYTHELEMDAVMESILRRPSHTASWLDFVLPRAEASSSDVVNSSKDSAKSGSEAYLPRIPTDAECKAAKIPDEKRASPGLHITVSMSSMYACGSGVKAGFEKTVESTKAAFISGFRAIDKHAAENQKKNPCPETEPLPPHATFMQIFWNSQAQQAESQCFQGQAGLAMAQTAGDMISETAKGVSALVNWVRTTNDPAAVIAAMVQSKVPAFMCVNGDTQTAMLCKFLGAATTAVAAAAATGAVTGGVGALGEGATLTSVGMAALRSGAAAAIDTLMAPATAAKAVASVPKLAVKAAMAAPRVAADTAKAVARALAGASTIAEESDARTIVRMAMSASGNGTKPSEMKSTINQWVSDQKNLNAAQKADLQRHVGAQIEEAEKITKNYGEFLKGTQEENAHVVELIAKARAKKIDDAKIVSTLKASEKACLVPR